MLKAYICDTVCNLLWNKLITAITCEMFHPMDRRKHILRPLIICLISASGLTLSLSAQEVRSIDGKGNNPNNTEWGAAHTRLITPTGLYYEDAVSTPTGSARPNPRVVSNSIFSQSENLNNQLELSDYVWVFGQFVDHDITLVENNVDEPIFIQVPADDQIMDPTGSGQVVIPMFRSAFDPATGTDQDNPRIHMNSITSFVDASAVYGSDDRRAMWLRTFEGGKLKTSQGNLLPFNTVTGEFNDPTDQSAPFMANDVQPGVKLFVAGDVRANENPLLLAFHTLFVREHNRLCEVYQAKHPDWDDERIYQKARRVVSGQLQSIVYDEWLPSMGIHLPLYTGYDPQVDPSITNVFAAAAFRMGHTLLSSVIIRMDESGETIPQGNLLLRDGFFAPMEILLAGGVDPYFKGMGTQIQQDLDCKVIDDVRNFLFGPPGAGGLDLAAINIMRGRERGLGDINSIRVALGLEPFNEFSEICANPELYVGLSAMYGTVDELDPWVGMLAEDHMPSALFGETIMAILEDQFQRLRDGDRFFYLNDDGLTPEEKTEIRETLFSDIIRRNTGVTLMQDNVFIAKEHSDLPFAGIDVTKRNLDFAVFPNPVVNTANFKAYVTEGGRSELAITDVQGRIVYTDSYDFRQGINTFSVETGNLLLPGIYYVRLEKDGNFNVLKLIAQ